MEEIQIQVEEEPIAIVGGAVNSVNGQTGDVVLTAEDVGALPNTTAIPSKTSDLENDSDYQTGDEVNQAIGIETTARENADNGLQGQIDALSAASDVTDIVGTYADLQAYDTSKLKDNDIIKVLQDENQNDETTYYRWSTSTETFTLIGEEGPYYTKAAADQKFQDKLTAGSNITIDANNEISADIPVFTGTDGVDAGTAGKVPAPATTDAGKYLKADGTWDTVSAGPNVVQTTGTSATDVMSQAATTNMIYPSGSETSNTNIFIKGGGQGSPNYVCIGPAQVSGNVDTSNGATAIGGGAMATGTRGVAIAAGSEVAQASGQDSIAIRGKAQATNSIAIGRNANVASASTGSIAIGYNAGSATSAPYAVALGRNAYTNSSSIAIGDGSSTSGNDGGIAIGRSSRAFGSSTMAIGENITTAGLTGSVVIGNGPSLNTAYATRNNEFCVHASTTANQPMVHSNVDTPTLGTDAANKNYVDTRVLTNAGAPTTSTVGVVGQLLEDTTNGKLYQCTDATNPYVWTEVGAGGGGGGSGIPTDATIFGATYDSVNNKVDGPVTINDGNGGSVTIGQTNSSTSNNSGALITTGNALQIKAKNQLKIDVGTGGATTFYNGGSIGLPASMGTYNARIFNLKAEPMAMNDAASAIYVASYFPVGTVIMSTSATAPSIGVQVFGMTWTQIGSQTIGSKTVYYYERTA